MKKNIVPIAAIAAALLLLNSRSSHKNYDDISTDAKGKALQAAMNPQTIGKLLADDNSPYMFSGSSSAIDPDKLLSILDNINQKYANRIQAIADQSSSGVEAVLNRLGATLEGNIPEGYAMSEKGLDLYFKALGIWLDVYTKLSSKSFEEFSKMADLGDVTSCVKNTYTKDVTEVADQQNDTWFANSVESSSFSIAWGILGKGGGSSSTTIAGSTIKRNEKRHITYIQHCEQQQVDPAKVEAALGSRTLVYSMILNSIRQWFKQAPDPLVFCSKVDKTSDRYVSFEGSMNALMNKKKAVRRAAAGLV